MSYSFQSLRALHGWYQDMDSERSYKHSIGPRVAFTLSASAASDPFITQKSSSSKIELKSYLSIVNMNALLSGEIRTASSQALLIGVATLVASDHIAPSSYFSQHL